jgi:DNA-binding transcriptional ArsR family regulator
MFSQPASLNPADPLERVWRALSDPTRRAILDRLRVAPATTGDLAAAFPQSRFAVMKHLDVLVSARLVIVRREGRERWNHLNPIPLQEMHERWVRPYEALWAAPLVRLKTQVESPRPQLRNRHMSEPVSPSAPVAPAGMVTVTMDIAITAPVDRVWTALTTDVSQWWPRDFLVAAEPLGMQFEPRLGGRLFEEGTRGGGVIWYTVYGITQGESIDLVGQLSPAFGGPAQSLLRLSLREQGSQTILSLTDAVVGNVGPKSEASLGDGWRAIFERGLKQFVERGGTL